MFLSSNERNNSSVDDAFRYSITQPQLEKLKRIAEQYPDFKFEIFDELFELPEFWNLDDEIFKDILSRGKYYYGNKIQQECLKDIIIDGKLEKWLEVKKEKDFLPLNVVFFDDRVLETLSIDELRILSTSVGHNSAPNWEIIEKSIKAGTFKNILPYIKEKISIYQKDKHVENSFSIGIKKPENCTDENIELFGGIENIENFGNEILTNEEYLKNYKYIKDNFGQMNFPRYSSIIEILSDENVKRIGYENIFKFFNNPKFEDYERLNNIPENIKKEKFDKVIEIYGMIPKYKGFYNEKIIEAIKKAREEKIEINFENRWISEETLQYIIENELEENIVTILNTDIDKFVSKDKYGIDRLNYSRLKLMTPKILEQLGIENVVKIANLWGLNNILKAQEKDLLSKWKNKIDSVNEEGEKDIIFSIKSLLLLDEKNNDLSVAEIKRINSSLASINEKNIKEMEELIKENPEFIRLLEIPSTFIEGTWWYEKRIKENLGIEEIESQYKEFKEIRNILGNDSIIKLTEHGHEDDIEKIYKKMQQAYQNGTLENWKKLLEIDSNFIPNNIEVLNDYIFNNNSPENIIKINDLNWKEKFKRIVEHYPKCLFYTYSIEELLNLDKNILLNVKKAVESDRFDSEIISLIQDSANFKKYIREIFEKVNDESIKETIEKAEKFKNVVHFIPSLKVVKKYPEEQIEKFNKKIWFNLAKNELYSYNNDTKGALVEAVLSLGIFENDEGQKERLGLLQKFATYLPKEDIVIQEDELKEKDESKEKLVKNHFEILEKKIVSTFYRLNMEKLLKDPNILNLFNSKEEAEKELSKLNKYYSYMEDEFQKEYVNQQYKDIMEYIYINGYDKVNIYEYVVRLKTDIQRLKMKDKKGGQKLENEVRHFYYDHDHDVKGTMTPNCLHTIFDGMDMKYKEGFYEFFRDNLEQIMSDPKKQHEISKIQNQWENIVVANLGQKITFEKCESYIYSHRYDNVQENEKEIAKLSSMCGYSQEQFEIIQKIFREQLKRTKSSIPHIEKKNEKNGYTYKVLRLDDPVAIFVGELTDCCQALGKDGDSCMRHSVTSPNGRILVVQDENGKVLSQSWIWRNKNVLCFDNIEAIEKDSNNRKVVSSEIFDMIRQAAKDFVETDKKHLLEWKNKKIESLKTDLAQGKISEDQYEAKISKIDKIIKGQQLSRVTVGIGYTDVDLRGLKHDKENRYPEEYVEYIADSRTQLILYEDSEVENENTDIDTVSIYSDPEDSKNIVDVDITAIEEYDDDEYDDDDDEYDYDYDDDEYDYDDDEYDYDDDEYDDEEYDDEEYDDEEYDDDQYDDNEEMQRRNRNSIIKFKEEVYKTTDETIDEIIGEYSINSKDSKISLEDIRKTINHVVGRNQARKAIENIRRYLKNERGE